MAAETVTTSSFHLTADLQLASPFFTLLPSEIRNLIYREFRHLSSPRRHIVAVDDPESPDGGPTWMSMPCITDTRARDVRSDMLRAASSWSPEERLWSTRLKSEWCLHWRCEEQDFAVTLGTASGAPPRTGVLDLLTMCKRM